LIPHGYCGRGELRKAKGKRKKEKGKREREKAEGKVT
jgi:hypothetical protein